MERKEVDNECPVPAGSLTGDHLVSVNRWMNGWKDDDDDTM